MSVKSSIVKKGFGLAMPAYFGLQEFQTNREMGKGVIESGVRAGADFLLSEAMGTSYILFNLGMAVPSLGVTAYQAIDQMARQSNSINANVPFSNARFQDTKQAHTMRQAGMELAKASRYNLEQSLMGNEASYFKM